MDNQKEVKKSTIYTRGGDKGTSSLYNGTRVEKTNEIFDALGNLDELNASLGVALNFVRIDALKFEIENIQCRLLDIGSAVATPRNQQEVDDMNNQKGEYKTCFSNKYLKDLEESIDLLDSRLPKLTEFILPSGGMASSHLHSCRTICRRAERSVLRVQPLENSVGSYLNRLSDYLFVAARYCAMKAETVETRYRRGKITKINE
jgi:cob(I)alamin adenosyltransferase